MINREFWLEVVRSQALSALIGGLIGVLGSLLITTVTFWREKKERAESTLEAIKAEIRSIVNLMEEADYAAGLARAAKHIEDTQQPYFFTVPVKIDLFTKVYSANLSTLGFLNKNYLPDIVSFYALVHALVMDLDSVKQQSIYPELVANQLKIYKTDTKRVLQTILLGRKIIRNAEVTLGKSCTDFSAG